MTMTNFS